jgi:hypothetical protein
MFQSISTTCFLAAALSALPAVSLAGSVTPAHENQQAAEVFKDFEYKAADAADQIADLDANTRSPQIGWEAYATRLQTLKDDVNDMGRIVARLDSMRAYLTAADRQILDRATPVLKELADDTNATVLHFNRDRQNFWTPTYHKYISSMMTEADQLSNSLNHALELDKVHAREQHLEKAIESGE